MPTMTTVQVTVPYAVWLRSHGRFVDPGELIDVEAPEPVAVALDWLRDNTTPGEAVNNTCSSGMPTLSDAYVALDWWPPPTWLQAQIHNMVCAYIGMRERHGRVPPDERARLEDACRLVAGIMTSQVDTER